MLFTHEGRLTRHVRAPKHQRQARASTEKLGRIRRALTGRHVVAVLELKQGQLLGFIRALDDRRTLRRVAASALAREPSFARSWHGEQVHREALLQRYPARQHREGRRGRGITAEGCATALGRCRLLASRQPHVPGPPPAGTPRVAAENGTRESGTSRHCSRPCPACEVRGAPAPEGPCRTFRRTDLRARTCAA